MKIQVSGEKFKEAVNLSERITGKNLTLPVLSALLITASGKSIKIRATNLSLGIEFEIPAVVEKEGVVLVKGDVLSGIVSHLPNEDKITLESERENLVVKTKKSKLLIKSLPPEDFPTLPTIEGNAAFQLDTKVLIDGIRSVYFCAATSDIKPEISSLYLYTDQGNLVFVATDSFRLAEKKVKVKQLPDISQLLIPFKNIIEIMKILEVFGGTVRVAYTKNLLSLSGNGVYLTSRLVDGVFPDYRQIIPKEWNTQAVLLKQEFLNTLRLSTVFTDKFQQITLGIFPKEKKVSIQSKNADVGENSSDVDGALQGDSVDVSVNLRYILDAFQALNGDSVSIEVTQATRPIVVKSVNDTSFIYLLMPLNR